MHLQTNTSANAHFANVPTITQPRNAFSISEKHVSTIQFDYLYPVYHKFIYPGDTLSITKKLMGRLQTQIAVLYDDLYIDLHAWFVPMRLIQTNWARFQFNAQPAGPTQDNSALTTPNVDLTKLPDSVSPAVTKCFQPKSLYDYFGYPTLVSTASFPTGQHINNYLPRAYNLIWAENYRDQNYQDRPQIDLGEGPDDPTKYVLLKRGKRHDKFTSALPAQQKGTPVQLSLGGQALLKSTSPSNNIVWQNPASPTTVGTINTSGTPAGNSQALFGTRTSGLSNVPETLQWPTLSHPFYNYADLSTATPITVNAFRQAVAVQHLLEADARGGTRDVESIANRWGVQVPDFRMQRPEWLGGQTFSFDGHIVPQTSETGSTPQGNLTQFSQTMSALDINHSFVEHGIFMILCSARSNITYQQGLQREISYKTRFDFYQPEFAHLGEVAMKNKEIFFGNNNTTNEGTFGFNEYGYELRFSENRVSGEMRSNFPQSLDIKHLADDYASQPTLGPAWIQSNTTISRNIAVEATQFDPIELNMLAEGTIARTMPMYSVPGLERL